MLVLKTLHKTLDFAFLLYLYDPSQKRDVPGLSCEDVVPKSPLLFRQEIGSSDPIEASGREKSGRLKVERC
jgi:hypothetical protein